ncbi:MAG: VOC family protein [Lentisphaeria bacterium]|nr:VOC family protein [Lentisphaeria bacterium]
MKKTAFGIVLKVKNLPACRAFYRDILELGEPVLDSSFRAEFRFGEIFSLILEKDPWETVLPAPTERVAWLYAAGNAETIRKRMTEYGYPAPESVSADAKGGMALCRFCDPEGNPFYVPADKN